MSAKKLIIITDKIFNFETESYSIGGYQTYVKDLARLGVKMGIQTLVLQCDDKNAECKIDGYEVRAVKSKKSVFKSAAQFLYDSVKNEDAIVVISSDQQNVRAKRNADITIQHGIAFDHPVRECGGLAKYPMLFLSLAEKTLCCLRNVSRYFYSKNLVCVDYNFYNWLITLAGVNFGRKLKVIPNYAQAEKTPEEIEAKLASTRAPRKIVFARRFVPYRGCLIFLNVLKVLLKKYPDLEVAFAGSGPLSSEIEKLAAEYKNVKMTRYAPDKSVEFLSAFDISLVPTVCSEGTSLTLIESMVAGCYPIATHIGGMTNIILDGYNGKLIYPSEAELLSAIEEAMAMDRNEYARIVRNAFESGRSAFSKGKWENSWKKIIEELAE